ncbi:MAG: hypothetical protein HY900_32095, partial [Deltaproteobacteria bacterium]|nr:hypothetical protein [Deltaproteobacteria bacterium]
MLRRCAWIFFLLLAATCAVAAPDPAVHHELAVSLDPERGHLQVEDRITLPEGLPLAPEGLSFTLHAGLSPASRSEGVRIERLAPRGAIGFPVPAESFRAHLPRGTRTFSISYAGEIRHPVESEEAEYARGFRETPGLISGDGVYLSESSLWYPRVENALVTSRLEVRLPKGWESVSQGTRSLHELAGEERRARWESPEPQTGLFLIAARFTEYHRREEGVEGMAFLRSPDPQLAERYLAATGAYLAMYSRLLGPYPYGKFALVENFWETGYGMPSFTLLGSRILRFPFILTSSYPHEILHNWWGNGVYVALDSGNWTEGLTAYLSDHLFQEQKGEGAAYREVTLQKYADYVSKAKDFPLSRFLARHSSATEAVGYGKALMFFHMLRLELGDETFVRALRGFYQREKFRRAGFGDLRRAFEAASGRDLSRIFRQWVERTGAPILRLSGVQAATSAAGHRVRGVLEQIQPGEPYLLRVPLAVTVEGSAEAAQATVSMSGRRQRFDLAVPATPLRLEVDPEFDVFRAVDAREIAPALSGAFGAERVLAVLPSRAAPSLLAGYRGMARTLVGAHGAEVEVRLDSELSELPRNRAVWVVGWENRWVPELDRLLRPYDASLGAEGLRVGGESYAGRGRSAAFMVRPASGGSAPLAFLASDNPQALPGLTRKLPHYHKWSWLVFDGAEPTNVAKGRWRVTDSPLAVSLLRGSTAPPARLAVRRPLATLQRPGREAVLETIGFLTDARLEGRGFGSRGLDRAAEFIAARFREAGLLPGGEGGSYFQSWRERGGEPEAEVLLRNVVGLLPGSEPAGAGGSVVVGAHYDHLGRGWPD